MKRINLVALALTVPVLASLVISGDELLFAPSPDTGLTKSFETIIELSLDETRIVVNGEEQDPAMVNMEMTMSNTSTFSWTDSFAGVENGRPTRVARTFEVLDNVTTTSQSSQFSGSVDSDIESTSELTDLTVNFTWDVDEASFVASFPEDEDADEALLEGLDEDTDLRGLLPEGPVQVGDTWNADASYLVNLLGPGGNLKLVPDESDLPNGFSPDPTSESSFSEMLGEIKGDIECEYKGMREVDGQQLSMVSIEIDVSSANDLTEMLMDKMEEMDLASQDVKIDVRSADVELNISGKGVLLWNPKAGHFASFEFTGDMDQTMNMAMTTGTPMGDMEIEQSTKMSGTISFNFSTSKE